MDHVVQRLALDYVDLHLQLLASCSCLCRLSNPCCVLWMQSGNNRVAVPFQLFGVTYAKVLQGWLLKASASLSRVYWDGTQNSCRRPMLGSWWSWRRDDLLQRVLLVIGDLGAVIASILVCAHCLEQVHILQPVHILLVQRGPKPNTIFQV